MGNFFTLVLAVAIFQLLWSAWGAGHLWRGFRLWLACLFFAALDLGTVWFLMLHLPGLHDVDGGLQLALVLLLTAQGVFNGLVTAASLIRFILRRLRRVPFDLRRRELLQKSFLYPLLAGGISAYGGFGERKEQVLREVEIPLQGLTAPEGYRILQLSDVHLGPFFSLEDLQGLLEQAAAQGADLLAVTGDVFDDERIHREAAALLDSFVPEFPDGIYFVLGNHEHFRGAGTVRRLLGESRVILLDNEARQVPGKDLWLAGTDYPMRRDRFEEDRQQMARRAFSQVPAGVTSVFLAHHPECIDDGAELGAALTLTGHTHGGQFGLLGLPLFPFFRYTRGLVRKGKAYGYVHCGNGSWFPCRIGCPPEIAVFTLVNDK